MVTKTNEEGIYPIVHYKYNNPIFYVNADGCVYSAMYVSFSDSTSKTNIAPLESSLDKLKHLKGVSYNFKRDLENLQAPIMAETAEIGEQIAEERTRKRVGLIAQEVEEVFPEVVRTRFDGEKGIMYSDLVSVLIAGKNVTSDYPSGNYTVKSGKKLILDARDNVTLSGGFTVEKGATLEIK